MHDFTPARKRMQWCHGSAASDIANALRARNNFLNQLRGRIDKMADGLTEAWEFKSC
jgi:hypothetical protein